MLLLIPVYFESAFLFLGAVAYILCILAPPTRRNALGVAVWFPVFGASLLADLALAGLLAAVHGVARERPELHSLTRLPPWHATANVLLVLLLLLSIAVATSAAMAHQWLARRLTFQLFRLYSTLVSAGIGSTLAWGLILLEFVNIGAPGIFLSLAQLIVLTSTLGVLGFRLAGELRGTAPDRYTWITSEEFYGTVIPQP